MNITEIFSDMGYKYLTKNIVQEKIETVVKPDKRPEKGKGGCC